MPGLLVFFCFFAQAEARGPKATPSCLARPVFFAAPRPLGYLPRSAFLLHFFPPKQGTRNPPAGVRLAAAMAFAALLDGLQIKSHEEVLADFKAHPKLVDYADAFADGVDYEEAQRATQAQLQLELGELQPPTYLGLRFCCTSPACLAT